MNLYKLFGLKMPNFHISFMRHKLKVTCSYTYMMIVCETMSIKFEVGHVFISYVKILIERPRDMLNFCLCYARYDKEVHEIRSSLKDGVFVDVLFVMCLERLRFPLTMS